MTQNRNYEFAADDAFAEQQASAYEADRRIYGIPERGSLRQIKLANLVDENGALKLGAFVITRLGMAVDGQVSEQDWLKLGTLLSDLTGSLQWLIADWLAYGEREYGRTYADVADLLPYEEKTLRNLSWIGSRVKLSRHRDKLGISRCAVLAGIENPQERLEWLDYAASLDPLPTVRHLTAMLNGLELEPPKTPLERLTFNAAQVRVAFANMARKKKRRAELRAFAAEQIEYWKQLMDSLEGSN